MKLRRIAHVAAGVVCASCLSSWPAGLARAQGTPGAKAPGAVAPPALTSGGGASADSIQMKRGDEREATRLLIDAEAELAQGDRRIGVRLLELMIARYPATLAAAQGSARLETLAAPIVGGAASVAGAVNQGWRPRVRLARTEAEEFRLRAGDRVFFSERSAELGGRARAVLATQAAWLKANPTAPVVIEAHADDAGSAIENLELAQRRGEAVQARLVEEGVTAARIRVAAIGRRAPAASCAEPICAAQNRRVVTLIALRSPLEDVGSGLAGATGSPVTSTGPRPARPPGMNALGGPPLSPPPR